MTKAIPLVRHFLIAIVDDGLATIKGVQVVANTRWIVRACLYRKTIMAPNSVTTAQIFTSTMTKDETKAVILTTLRESGLSWDDQVKVLAMSRVAIQPRMSESDWRRRAKPILRPSGGLMGKPKREKSEK